MKTKNDMYDLPHLAELFEALRRGRHITMRDGDMFHALKKHETQFETLFEKLGFKLLHHQRDFFYFYDSSNFTDTSARMAVFMFIMVEWLADRGEPVEETILTDRFNLNELPHLDSERYQTYMNEAGVTSPEDLANILRSMERLSFARRRDAESFSFEPPVYRFLDLCMDMAARSGKDAAKNPETDQPEEPK